LAIWLNRSSLYSDMIVAILTTRALCYALYPNGDQRYTAVLFGVVPVALVIGVRLATLRGSTTISAHETIDSLESSGAGQFRGDPAVSPAIAR